MASSPSQIREEFLRTVPDDALRLLAQCVWLGYPEAHDLCSGLFLSNQAHDVRGHVRRATIERNIRNVVTRIPGASQSQTRNKTNSHTHTVVRMGNVLLTQSQAEGPDDIIQTAEFRKGYAMQSQLELFGGRPSDTVGDRHLYALLLHGPAYNSPRQPRFMSVVFPTRDCQSYVFDATISMYERFSDLAAAARNDRVEEIPDDLKMDLRRLDREGDGDAAATA
jgi:hypothetical protein